MAVHDDDLHKDLDDDLGQLRASREDAQVSDPTHAPDELEGGTVRLATVREAVRRKFRPE